MSRGTRACDAFATSASKLPERRQVRGASVLFFRQITKCCCDPRALSGWCRKPAQAYPAIPCFLCIFCGPE
jgi:hypothetical protein